MCIRDRVNTGAELIRRVTRPEEIYRSANIKNQLIENTEKNPVIDASLKIVD